VATAASAEPRAYAHANSELRPLTERVLARLPGPRVAWIAIWALVPWLNAALNLIVEDEARSAVWEQGRTLVILNYTVLSVGIVVAVWGTNRLARRLETLHSTDAFRPFDSVWGPVGAAAATAVAFGITALAADGLAPAVLRGLTWFVVGIALWTFLWAYGCLQLGLDRIADEHLDTQTAPADPGLGLRPLGETASMGLWMLFIWLAPLVLTGLPDVVGVVVGLGLLALGLGVFLVSIVRLHRRMIEVKAAELAVARDLYAQAYAPVRASPTLDVLERQRNLLSAADALERRAQAIHDWPIDEGTVARVLTITTSVVAISIARLILDPLGL
jgi:hypothetical protein